MTRPPVAVSLDIQDAFDTMCHELLLLKLEWYDFRGVALVFSVVTLVVESNMYSLQCHK